MSNFDLVYQAAKKKDVKKISLLRLENNSLIYEKKGFELTPAGQCALEGDWESACWLMTECGDSVNSILYGAIIGGHINSFKPPMDSLPEPLTIILNKCDRQSDRTMLKAFAQRGDLRVVDEYASNKEQFRPGEIIDAAISAAYGNQVHILNFLLEKFPQFRNELLCAVLEGAAWGGHKELLLQYLEHYNREKNLSPGELHYEAKRLIMLGCGSGGQLELLNFIKSSYPPIYNSDIYDAFKAASFHNQDNFIKELIKQDPKLIDEAQCAMATMSRIDFLEKLLSKETNFSGIAIFISDRITSASALFIYLIEFTKPEYVQKLCKALVARKEIKAEIIENIHQIEHNSLKVIDLKNRYGITTIQARFLYEHPDILSLIISTQYDNNGIFNLLNDKETLNYWQFTDLVKRVQKNKAKSQLIDDLEEYLHTKTSWWYNHRGRCASFLDALKETKSHKTCRGLVADQFRLFSAPEAPSQESTNQEIPKHASAVRQSAVKDEYYDALKKYQDTMGDENKTNTMISR